MIRSVSCCRGADVHMALDAAMGEGGAISSLGKVISFLEELMREHGYVHMVPLDSDIVGVYVDGMLCGRIHVRRYLWGEGRYSLVVEHGHVLRGG